MPTPEEILNGLGQIANEWRALAIIWHVYFAGLVSVLLVGVRPSKRIVGASLSLPIMSVSVLAWNSSNPFNGFIFLLAAAVLLSIVFRLPGDKIQIAPLWISGAGAIMFFFGWSYPHFLETESYFPYLYAAPTGLIPCPTLSIVIGLSIALGSFGDRLWSVILAIAGIFYSIFGAIHLGVSLDWVLLLGSILILFTVSKNTEGNQTSAFN